MYKCFLDDVRQTPQGYIRFRTVEALIEFLTWNPVDTVSLDNDLGNGFTEGYQLARWIEESAYNMTLNRIPNLICHSQNNVAVNDMNIAFTNASKYWDRGIEYWESEYQRLDGENKNLMEQVPIDWETITIKNREWLEVGRIIRKAKKSLENS